MTALDELRQALAEWDRLTKAATSRPWWGNEVGVWFGTGTAADRIVAETYSERGVHDADLIVAAVGLAQTVRAILVEAIKWAMPNTPYLPHIDPTALRLARAINENAA